MSTNQDEPPVIVKSAWKRWLGSIELWVILSLVFIGLMRGFNPDSPEATNVWFIDPLLSLLFLWLLRRHHRYPEKKLKLSPGAAAVTFVSLSWLLGMLTELTISMGSGGYGGLHPKTIPSFILAQGYYIPLAVLGLYFVRRYHVGFYELFFAAGMTSLYEAVFFGIPMMITPLFPLIPVVIAYYFVIYSRLLSMLLLVMDERSLWDQSDRQISFRRKLWYGFLLGIACWIIFIVWGTAMDYLFDGYSAF